MSEKHDSVSVREMATSLGLRLGTCYGLLWDGVVAGEKDENGEWRVRPESIERYRVRRNLRRAVPRAALQRGAIDIATEPRAGT
jgi:hypothetical protein